MRCKQCGRFMHQVVGHPDKNLEGAFGCDHCELLFKAGGYDKVDTAKWFRLCGSCTH